MPTTRPEVLLAAPLPDFLRLPLEAAYTCHVLKDAQPHLERIRAAIPLGGTVLSTELLASMPALEIVSVMGVGYDGVPIPYCRERGIRVTNTPDVLTDDVADIAVALVLMTSRRLVESNRYLHAGSWLTGPFPLAHAVRGKTAGIFGLGRIGKAIARRLEAHGMKIAYHGRKPQNVPWAYFDDLQALAAESDFLVIACPGGPETQKRVDAPVLAALGREGTLINIARGSVVDEAALITALRAGTIRGAGLDVFEDEPRVPAELLACENAVLLPHVGSATHETRLAMANLVLENLAAHFADRELITPVC
ncbi:MAG: 2-hydroxyacid dehydrogenase [Verrucomicrobiaceae bacterium]|nr:2-hydroxyacid dehydrogenase [Verrucomicrobiaceae bacterium]